MNFFFKLNEGGGGNSTAALMLSLNFILLSFFIVLVSMATAHTSKKELALAGISAEFRQQDESTPQPSGPFLPHQGASGWQQQISVQVLGMVASFPGVSTPEMETTADRLLVRLPLAAVFSGTELTEAARKSIPNLIQLAAAAEANVELWLATSEATAAKGPAWLPLLGGLAGGNNVGWRLNEPSDGVWITYHPRTGGGVPVQGDTLNRLPGTMDDVGGSLHGAGD